MALVTKELKTSGMHCRSCSMVIQMEVGELEGVSEVAADHAAGTTTVTYDDSVVSIERIIEAIHNAGYEAEAQA